MNVQEVIMIGIIDVVFIKRANKSTRVCYILNKTKKKLLQHKDIDKDTKIKIHNL